jgi:hypothetical protein
MLAPMVNWTLALSQDANVDVLKSNNSATQNRNSHDKVHKSTASVHIHVYFLLNSIRRTHPGSHEIQHPSGNCGIPSGPMLNPGGRSPIISVGGLPKLCICAKSRIDFVSVFYQPWYWGKGDARKRWRSVALSTSAVGLNAATWTQTSKSRTSRKLRANIYI